MTAEFAYFLKVNVAFVLFYAFYRLLFYKDTFFKMRRAILLTFFVLAVSYPLLNIQEWVRQQEPIAQVIYIYSSMLPEATANANDTMPEDWLGWAAGSLGFVYWSMVIALCGRFLVQLGSILWLAHTSERKVVRETLVHALTKPSGPFSFFRLIFLHPSSHSDKEVDEILTHESTHVSQWHSVDVIVGELICMVCWFNPFVWLLKREVRHNLEYLADNTVLQSGYDSKSYQYHLLGLAHQQSGTSLYNSFNVLHLKNRILMMNKKRSPGIWRTKYLLLIPLAAIVMLLSNIETVSRMASRLTTAPNAKMATVEGTLVDEVGQPLIAASVLVEGEERGTLTDANGKFSIQARGDATLQYSYPGKEVKVMPVADMRESARITLPSQKKGGAHEQVFTVVEQMPKFPGGDSELLKYISKSLIYPTESQNNGDQGRVICSFIVDAEGYIRDPEVVRGLTPLLDAEAIRVINSMPRWEPGMQRGKQVSVKYTIPITYRLSRVESQKTESQDAKKDYLTVVDEMPRYPGGDEALLKFVGTSVKYPIDAQTEGTQGRVICSFVIDTEGNVVDPHVVRGISTSLDNEAIRVIKNMPRWIPGKQGGKTVRVLYTIPITFRLE